MSRIRLLATQCAFCYHSANMHEGPESVEKSCTSCSCEVFVMPVFRHQPPLGFDSEARAADPTMGAEVVREKLAEAGIGSTRESQVGGNHYKRFKIQPWDVIDEYGLDFYRGNVVKYLLRAGHKGVKLEDLKKARHYLDRVIEIEERKRKET